MVVLVQLEREEEVTGPVIAPLFPQVCVGTQGGFLGQREGGGGFLCKVGTVPNAVRPLCPLAET